MRMFERIRPPVKIGTLIAGPALKKLPTPSVMRSEEHTSELQSPCNLVCRLLLEKKKTTRHPPYQHVHTDSCSRATAVAPSYTHAQLPLNNPAPILLRFLLSCQRPRHGGSLRTP